MHDLYTGCPLVGFSTFTVGVGMSLSPENGGSLWICHPHVARVLLTESARNCVQGVTFQLMKWLRFLGGTSWEGCTKISLHVASISR